MGLVYRPQQNMLTAPPHKHSRRVGRGIGSGLGKTCTRGMNGQLSRSGGRLRIGFEGGQMPIYRRLPRKGFSNSSFKIRHKVISLARIAEIFQDNEQINRAKLIQKNVVKNSQTVKIVSGEKISKKFILNLRDVCATKTVVDAIKNSGGDIIQREIGIKSRRTIASARKKARGNV